MNLLKYNLINTSKFKEVILDVKFFVPKTKDNATKMALLAFLSSDRNYKYKTKLSIREKLDDLFGAHYHCVSKDLGRYLVLEYQIRFINDKYVSSDNLKKAAIFLKTFIDKPLINDKTFDENCRVLKESLIRYLDEPINYAFKRVYEIASNNSFNSISCRGYLEDLRDIKLADINNFKIKVLDSCDCLISCCGDIEIKKVKHILKDIFPKENCTKIPDFYYKYSNIPLEYYEYYNNPESILIMLFSVNNLTLCDYYSFKVGCVLLGQMPNSLLYQNVRENKNLCYDISSFFSADDYCLNIVTEITQENISLVKSCINNEIDNLIKQNYNPELLIQAKKMMVDSYQSSKDSIMAILNHNIIQSFENHSLSEKDYLLLINKVTLDDISKVFKSLNKPTIYSLIGNSNGKDI